MLGCLENRYLRKEVVHEKAVHSSYNSNYWANAFPLDNQCTFQYTICFMHISPFLKQNNKKDMYSVSKCNKINHFYCFIKTFLRSWQFYPPCFSTPMQMSAWWKMQVTFQYFFQNSFMTSLKVSKDPQNSTVNTLRMRA